jgi:hypothetical protein
MVVPRLCLWDHNNVPVPYKPFPLVSALNQQVMHVIAGRWASDKCAHMHIGESLCPASVNCLHVLNRWPFETMGWTRSGGSGIDFL